MNGTEEKSCEQRISEQMAGRTAQARDLFDAINAEDENEQDAAFGEMHNWPLAISRKTVFRLEISTGGPADWLEIVTNEQSWGYDIERVIYHFADWFDHAERPVDEGSPLWRIAEYFIESQPMNGEEF